jgi:hypothetical protein
MLDRGKEQKIKMKFNHARLHNTSPKLLIGKALMLIVKLGSRIWN